MNLRKIFIAAAVAAGFTASAGASQLRYVFYFIGDGMGLGHVLTTQTYNRTVLGSTDPLLMMQFPVNSVATTYSASSPVTDSAAAGTALSTGHKTNNSMLGVLPDSTAVTSIASTLYNRGFGIGIVTSVAPDDATPAAFYAHQPSRSMFYEIGRDAAFSGYDFIAGENLRGLRDKQGHPTDLMELLGQNGVTVIRGVDGLESVTTRRVMLLETDSTSAANNIGYTIDSVAGRLTLPVMTEACLRHLEKNAPANFFMMVEGGNIDHAAHGNDGGAVIKEILNFNDAIRIAYNFYLAHPDETLIVVTADHDTGAMALANPVTRYAARLECYDSQRCSKEAFSDYCKAMLRSRRNFTWDDMTEYLRDYLGFWNTVPLTDKQTDELRDMFEATFRDRNTDDQKTLYNSFNAFAVKVFQTLNDYAGVGFITTSHAGNLVPVYAIGPGSEIFSEMNDNTDIPRKILELLK